MRMWEPLHFSAEQLCIGQSIHAYRSAITYLGGLKRNIYAGFIQDVACVSHEPWGKQDLVRDHGPRLNRVSGIQIGPASWRVLHVSAEVTVWSLLLRTPTNAHTNRNEVPRYMWAN